MLAFLGGAGKEFRRQVATGDGSGKPKVDGGMGMELVSITKDI